MQGCSNVTLATGVALFLAAAGCSSAARSGSSGGAAVTASSEEFPGLAAVTEKDLERDITALAGDAMRGREAGTIDELRASMWVAERAREAGLEAAGEDGTFFQFFPLRRMRLSAATRVVLGGLPLELWKDVVVYGVADTVLALPLVFVGEGKDVDLEGADLRGKAVAAVLTRPANPPPAGVSMSGFRYARLAVREQSAALIQRGAAAVVLVADSTADASLDFNASVTARGTYGLDTASPAQRARAQPPVLLVRRALLERVRTAPRLTMALVIESFSYPSVNVVGRIRGRDAQLASEYVLFSGHQDHDGVRYPMTGDSIWNGADDNATASVALLAIARAFARNPGRRSALFVWHGAEERGLLGSRWHAERSMVPRSSIVAVLNADMIGRNHPDTATLLGSQPPHRNSTALVNMAFTANARTAKFALDSTWDRPEHPEGFYFRSDHLPYARLGIPAVFFTTRLHADYHTPRDEPKTIDIVKLARVTRWMLATGWLVANADARPTVDPGFKLER